METNQLVSNIKTKDPSDFENNISAVAKGGGITFIGKLFTNVIRLALAIVLARVLGTTQLGYYNLALSAGNIAMGIALFGLDASVIRFIAIMVARDDEEGTWESIQIGIGLSLFLSSVMGVLLYAYSFYLSETVFNNPDFAPYLQLISVFVPLLVVNDQLFNTLRGFKEFNLSVLAQYIYQPITRLIIVGVLLVVGLNAKTAIASYGLATLTASGAMFYYLNRQFPLKRPLGVTKKVLKEIVEFSFPVWLSSLLVKFQGNIQTIFIGSLNTISGVGIFSVAGQISMVSGEFSSSINTTAKPIIAELNEKEDLPQMERIYQMANKWVVIAQLPIFLVMVVFPATLLSIFGEGYTEGASALIILAIAGLIKVGTGMGGIIIDMTGYTKMKLVNSIIRLAVFIILDLLLIPKWGVLGAAIAVLGGEGGVNILRMVQVFFIFKILPFNRSFFKPILATGGAVLAVIITSHFMPFETNYFLAALNILIMVLAYVGLIFLFGFSEEEVNLFKALTSNLKNKLPNFSRGKSSK